jgi:hypothetical protein
MSNGFESIFLWFGSLPGVTQVFIAVIFIIFVWFNWKYSPRVVALGPTILTTLGIFATFLGIALGLYHFDTSNVQASVPSLLDGLKTAFWASVFGVGSAVLIKLREFWQGDGRPPDEVGADDVSAADIVNGLSDIRKALTGAGDETLLSQVKLARQDSNDRLDKLREAQTEALKQLSEMGSKALVEALRDVIRDFNQNITEQFGENFKELNAAVGRLLEWQVHYKQTIETMTAKIADSIQLLGIATENFKTLVERSSKFSDVADRLSQTLSTLQEGESRLRDVAAGMVGLLNAASARVPEIESKVIDITRQMTLAVRQNQTELNAALLESASSTRNTLDTTQKTLLEIARSASEAARENQKIITSTVIENTAATKAAIQSSQQEMSKTNAELNRQAVDMIQKTKDQVAELDRALATELTKSLESLAGQLTALSERFVGDYKPLTNELRRVLEIARRVT